MNDRDHDEGGDRGHGMRRFLDFGQGSGADQHRRDRATVVGLVVTAVWLLLVFMFWMFAPAGNLPGGTARLLTAVGVVMPVALTWVAVTLARSVAALQAEAADLRDRLDQMRPSVPPGGARHGGSLSERGPAPSAPPRAADTALRDTAPARAAAGRVASPRAAAPSRTGGDTRQRNLPLDGDESVSVSAVDLLRALNFPDGPDDHEAIRALRAALADHDTMRLIRSAQDAVTLLAQAGVYMDDLNPRPAPPRLWRDFAEGERSPRMTSLAGLDDQNALDAASTLLRSDEIFRDAAHHFLRQYDRTLTRLAAEGDDDLLAALAETRSGRAFTLLAQTSGIFADGS